MFLDEIYFKDKQNNVNESIGEKVIADNEDDIIKQADNAISGRFVDLGLPSGTLWAKCNLGAAVEYEMGDLYGWGMTEPYKQGQSVDDYKQLLGKEIRKDLTDETDAATVQLGTAWRMPTKEEAEELIRNTYSCWGELNGVKGRFVFKVKNPKHKGKIDNEVKSSYNKETDEYIFLPAAGELDGRSRFFIGGSGDYWCSSYISNTAAYELYLGFAEFSTLMRTTSHGYSIRPVRNTHQPHISESIGDRIASETESDISRNADAEFIDIASVIADLIEKRAKSHPKILRYDEEKGRNVYARDPQTNEPLEDTSKVLYKLYYTIYPLIGNIIGLNLETAYDRQSIEYSAYGDMMLADYKETNKGARLIIKISRGSGYYGRNWKKISDIKIDDDLIPYFRAKEGKKMNEFDDPRLVGVYAKALGGIFSNYGDTVSKRRDYKENPTELNLANINMKLLNGNKTLKDYNLRMMSYLNESFIVNDNNIQSINEMRLMTDDEINKRRKAYGKQVELTDEIKQKIEKNDKEFLDLFRDEMKMDGIDRVRPSRKYFDIRSDEVKNYQEEITRNLQKRTGKIGIDAYELEKQTWLNGQEPSHFDDETLKNTLAFQKRQFGSSIIKYGKNLSQRQGNDKLNPNDIELSCKGAVMTYGNWKLPYDTLIFNMNSARNCPSKECTCRDVCYANKGHLSTHVRDARNQAMLNNITFREFVKLIDLYLDTSKAKIKYIRLSEAGDFIDQNQLDLAKKIALHVWCKHHVKTVIYTARGLDFGSDNPKIVTKIKGFETPKFEDYFIVNASNTKPKNATRFYLHDSKKNLEAMGIDTESDELDTYIDKNGEEQVYKFCKCNCYLCDFCYKSKKENGEDPNKMTRVYCVTH